MTKISSCTVGIQTYDSGIAVCYTTTPRGLLGKWEREASMKKRDCIGLQF